MRVLSVGSGNEAGEMPPWFNGWEVTRLDVNPACEPDLLMDARDLHNQMPVQFDAVFCSHNLEHYYPHEGGRVVSGMRHVLKPDGFVDAYVPNIGRLLQVAGKREWDLDTFMYQSPGGPILLHDMIYGYSKLVEFTEAAEWYAHKQGFSARTISLLFTRCGFARTYIQETDTDIRACAFKMTPSEERLVELGLAAEV